MSKVQLTAEQKLEKAEKRAAKKAAILFQSMKLKETLMRDNLVSDALNEILYNPHLAKASTSIIQDDNIYFLL